MSELDYKVYIHELVPEPMELRQIACLDCPEPKTEDTEVHNVSAIWAPDGSAALLNYMIRDMSDDRAQFNENDFFDVGPALGMDSACAAAAVCLPAAQCLPDDA